MLSALNFEVRIPSSTYAKYYFKLHTMRKEGGLPSSSDFVDIESAREKLEISPKVGYKFANQKKMRSRERSRSYGIEIKNNFSHLGASLEQLVVMGSIGRRSSTSGDNLWKFG